MSNEELAVLIRDGRTDLLGELWAQVKGFCAWRASAYWKKTYSLRRDCGVEVDDLIQSGYFAMCKACETYNPEKALFITHFGLCLLNCFAETCGLRSHRHDPILNSTSLDAPLPDSEDDSTLYDITSDGKDQYEDLIDDLYTKGLHEALEAVIHELPEREADLLRHLYWEGKTAGEIAETEGQPIMAIHRSREKAFRRIRHAARYKRSGRELKKYCDLSADCFTKSAEDALARYTSIHERLF